MSDPTYPPGGGEQGDDFTDVPTRDARSAIDADPFARAFGAWSDVTPERVRELVRRHSNDSDLGAAVRALVTEGE